MEVSAIRLADGTVKATGTVPELTIGTKAIAAAADR
jgi:hypothetical protein